MRGRHNTVLSNAPGDGRRKRRERQKMRKFDSRSAALGLVAMLGLELLASHTLAQVRRPNILWISTEDISPDLGCYGDSYAVTPNVDRLAAQGMRYTNAFATAPVCAPSRSAIITGMY